MQIILINIESCQTMVKAQQLNLIFYVGITGKIDENMHQMMKEILQLQMIQDQ
jgi:hypothetical protein